MDSSIVNLFRARKTILEMITDRGYEMTEPLDLTFDMFKLKYHSNDIDIYIVNSDREIYFKFITVYKIKPNMIREIISQVNTEIFTMENCRIVIVLLSKPNNTILKIKNEIYKNVEFFWLNRLIVNITHHQYVPLHELIDSKEIPDIMKRYNLSSIHQLPLIDRNDPVSRYYNYKPGDICKITRKNHISGISVIYRLVK